MDISQDKLKKIKEILLDPVKWAKVFVQTFDSQQGKFAPWEARWYQANMLHDGSLKRVARCGRRTGKCLPGWVKIYDPIDKRNYTVEELYRKKRANVVTMSSGHILTTGSATTIVSNGIKDVYKVRLSSGKEIDATGNHPLYTKNSWTEIDNLKIGTEVATVKKYPESASYGTIQWERVAHIEFIGKHQTYDLTVPMTHNFVANDIIVHNTEVMCIDMLHKTFTKKHFQALVITPYENQVRLIFNRIKELVQSSPLLKQEIDGKITSNPFQLRWKNGSKILGFTTGASSGSGGASIRGQKGDALYLDEVDYMVEADFDTIMSIAAERNDIFIFMSSTPTGKRSKFYFACTDKRLGFNEHHYPSTDNPNWCDEMEAEFKAQLTEQGYVHEILAEFGEQEAGVFNKRKVDKAMKVENYAYHELDYIQRKKIEEKNIEVQYYIYEKRAPINPFRTMGVDWDKSQAPPSIIILDYDIRTSRFKVINRTEIPPSEYTYDVTINKIVQLNDIYNPSWIYADRGAGDYQIERLHIIGEERPSTNLKNKVKAWQFKQALEIIDPVTKELNKKMLKPFMVTQLQIAFEREGIVLSPFDEVLYSQLINYEIKRISQYGDPVYSDKDEHFVDALGLAYLAFVLEFPDLTNAIKKIKRSTLIQHTSKSIGEARVKGFLSSAEVSPYKKKAESFIIDDREPRGERPVWVKLPNIVPGSNNRNARAGKWGSRANNRQGITRSFW